MSGDEPEDAQDETMPFTHRPYRDRSSGENPLISPSGPASQPSGPSYIAPGTPPPPMSSPPYGPPTPNPPPGWGANWVPAYGSPLPGSLDHKGATTSLVLGIISLVSLVLAMFCCVTLPGVFCAPFAWVIGAKAKREIDAAPGTYGNRGSAQAGFVMGIVCSLLGLVFVVGFVALLALLGGGWWWV